LPGTVDIVRILGIDPGIAETGWGVIEHSAGKSRLVAYGTISTSARDPLPERLLQIHAGIVGVIDVYQPQDAAIEELFGGVNLKTALSVGEARGVLVHACAASGVWPEDYTPLRIKQAVVGYGRATKQQVQQMVKALLSESKVPRPDHAADALAVAICHAHSARSQAAIMGVVSAPGKPRLTPRRKEQPVRTTKVSR
jgi:crossover junction endodeoxyribonuclease RuvC